jgi:hypothetical protein
MDTNLIDLRQVHRPTSNDLRGLEGYLAQLVGEPFRLARVSHGDELTLHFGDLRPARSPKLKAKPYGAYILSLRASPWVLKPGSEPLIVDGGALIYPLATALGTPLRREELESRTLIEPGSRVLSASPFVVRPADGIGLQLRLSDGSSLSVLPAIPEPDEPEDQGLPELADWELLSPNGLLKAGPGLEWSFEPVGGRPANAQRSG